MLSRGESAGGQFVSTHNFNSTKIAAITQSVPSSNLGYLEHTPSES